MAMDLLVPAPMPDICVRLWKSCPRPASHVVPRLTDRLHRDRTAILMPSTVRSSGAPPFVCDGKGYCCRPPCVPLVRLHSSATAKATSAVLHAFLWFASIRVRLWKTAVVRQVASIATGRQYSCRPPCVPLVRLHFDRSRQKGRRRQCRRLVVTISVVSAVSVVASVVSSVSVVVGTA